MECLFLVDVVVGWAREFGRDAAKVLFWAACISIKYR
jgi:hypothetical protein